MSGIVGISVITALCIFGFAFGAAVLYTALRDNEYIFAIIGGIIFVVSSIGFYYLDKPFTDVQNLKALLTVIKKMDSMSAKLKMVKKL